MLEGPVSVRSNMRTKSPGRTCMCIADTPMLAWRSCHSPGNEAGGASCCAGSCSSGTSPATALATQAVVAIRRRMKGLGLGMAD